MRTCSGTGGAAGGAVFADAAGSETGTLTVCEVESAPFDAPLAGFSEMLLPAGRELSTEFCFSTAVELFPSSGCFTEGATTAGLETLLFTGAGAALFAGASRTVAGGCVDGAGLLKTDCRTAHTSSVYGRT